MGTRESKLCKRRCVRAKIVRNVTGGVDEEEGTDGVKILRDESGKRVGPFIMTEMRNSR